MSEEEKKAIEDCDMIFINLEDMFSEESANYYRNSYKILKNLIKRQQNIIYGQGVEHQYDQKMIDDLKGEMVHNWIHKDKIREKIEKYEKNYIRQDKEELFNLTKITAGALSALQELLEEN